MRPFENLLKHRLDYKNLNCSLCEELYAQGDLAELPCQLCPRRLFPEPDECTKLAFEVWGLLGESPIPDQPPPIEFVFKLLGLEVPSEKALEVYRRLIKMKEIISEDQKLRRGSSDESSPELGAA